MENQHIRQVIRQELPGLLQRDREFREWVLTLTREQYADKRETESRFDRVLDELRRDREENTRKWEEQNRKWEDQNRKWEDQNRKWDEQNHRWEEQNRKWDENQASINAMLAEIRLLSRKHDSTLGALGARWGLHTEQSFRSALAGILVDSFGVEVINVTEYDDTGEVFGRPDQVELDVIIQNGMLILCEIKSSVSRAEMYVFDRKVTFYERRHERKATRKIVISPMVEDRAWTVAKKLGIEVYSYAEDVIL
ncbi:MAG: DUF3782 domain-containing protein [Anaerolineae bacterium]|nr:DUF3782 domain-containing protein [Anaerolineae bacterium]